MMMPVIVNSVYVPSTNSILLYYSTAAMGDWWWRLRVPAIGMIITFNFTRRPLRTPSPVELTEVKW